MPKTRQLSGLPLPGPARHKSLGGDHEDETTGPILTICPAAGQHRAPR